MNRIRSFRDIEGLSQAAVAELLDISPSLVSAVESGRRSFTGSIVGLGYADDRFEVSDMSEPHHRQRASTKVTSTRRAKELIRLGGEVFAELVRATPRAPHGMLERLPTPQGDSDIASHAQDVRGMLGQEDTGPIRNLTALAERAGVCLIPLTALKGIDGISAWVEGTPVIGLSIDVPGDRFRLSLAHEIGHLVMHTKACADGEDEANRFASLLLMPGDDFDEAMPKNPMLKDFVGLKSSWGMSIAAIVYRAHQEELIDGTRYRALQMQMSKWRKKEPAPFDPKHGTLLPKLVENHGGPPTVANRLGVNPQHLRELISWRLLRVA